MNNLTVNELCIEVTRRCNMNCPHCMRGESQNINLDINRIDNLFNNDNFNIIQINRLAITGGEPTLNSSAILKIIREIINKKIIINSFVMVINGSIYNTTLIEELNILYNYYIENEDKSTFELICSRDQFHICPKEKVLEKYSELPYFISNETVINNDDILCIGRAYNNQLGNIKSYILTNNILYNNIENNYPIIKTYSQSDIVLEELYLSSNGLYGFHIMDATYEMIDKLCIYNQNELEQLLYKYKVKRR